MPTSGEELASYFCIMKYMGQQTVTNPPVVHASHLLSTEFNCHIVKWKLQRYGEKRRSCSMLTGWTYNGHAIAIPILVVYKLRTPHVVSVVKKYQKRCECTGCAAVYVPDTCRTNVHT